MMHVVANSEPSRRNSVDRFCPVKQIRVHVSFCNHVCSHRDDCTLQATHSPQVIQGVHAIIPLTTADLSQLTQLGINPLQSKGQNLNSIQDQFLQDPQRTKQQVHALREIPWIHHQAESEWPMCDCLACCGALIITVIENASLEE